MVKAYSKPMVTRVELRPVEALLYACKTSVNIGTGWDLTDGACVFPREGCRDTCGS